MFCYYSMYTFESHKKIIMKLNHTTITGFIVGLTFAFMACEGPEGKIGPTGPAGTAGATGQTGTTPTEPTTVALANHSSTPALITKLAGFESLEVYSLISSSDNFASLSPFKFGGSADGAGLVKISPTRYSLLVNHEDNFAVSRITLDGSFKPIAGEYVLNSNGGTWRLCSATLATPEEHGFGPFYLTCGESGPESRIHAVNPFAAVSGASISKEVQNFGRWSAENAVPLPKTAYPNKTVVLIGDDDSGADGGQLAMYIPNAVGDIFNTANRGKVYVLRRVSQDPIEKNITVGVAVDIEFVEIANAATLTGAQINTESTALKSIAFGRVEDIDYRKDGVGREVYFCVTGQNGNANRTKYGRIYKLVMNATDPLKGTLEVALDGDNDAGPANEFQNPDNIMVTQNFAYIQEDANSYGDETHDAYIYQYDLATKGLKKAFELNHYRADATLSAQLLSANSAKGSWEYGAMIDVSSTIGIANTFLLSIQPHTWRSDVFKGVDGGALRPDENQGSQMVLIKGLAK
jgi:hypothetical protein